jgi:RTX calcium-binding nonapeptide repeat (4 copies)
VHSPRASLPVLILLLPLVAGTATAGAATTKHGVTAKVAHKTLTVSGDRSANKITLRAKRLDHNTLLVDVGDDGSADFSFKRKRFDKVTVRGGSGNDVLRLDETNGAFTKSERTSVDGQGGSDRFVVTGSPGNDSDTLSASGAHLRVVGTQQATATSVESVALSTSRGADAVTVGDLNGSGVRQVSLDGGDGADRLSAPGSPSGDSFAIGRFGPFVHVQRNALGLDAVHVERLDADAAGGADTVGVADLTGTDLKQLNLGLGGADGQADSVTANGSDDADAIDVASGFGIAVTGLAPAASITGTEPADALTVDGRGGADTIDASGLPAARMQLTLKGGLGNDTLTGSPGDDTFRSAPGDGADTIDGRGGIDTAAMDGSNAADAFSTSPNGARVQVTRAPDGGAVDATGVEHVGLNGLGGGDSSNVDDLAGTEVTQVDVDMGAGDGAADSATVNGTANADNVKLAGGGGGSVNVTALATPVSIAHSDPSNDTVTVATLGGNDTIDASNLAGGSAQLRLAGGQGADTLTGSTGDDTFVWNPGDESDTLDGNQGTDTLEFNGSNAGERLGVAASGSHLLVTRDVAAVTQNAAGIENVDLKPIGGSDTVSVSDLSATPVTNVSVDLAASGGGGDGTSDDVILNGTTNADTVKVSGDAGAVRVDGPQLPVTVTHAEQAFDHLTINSLDGADSLDAAGLAAGAMDMIFSGGRGNDTMIGSQGADTFVWNPGDGSDTIDGQAGADTLLFNGANVGEQIGINPNGSHLRFTRDVAAITLDAVGVEDVHFLARGGADTITVADLSGTDVTDTNIDLTNGLGAGDGAADNVLVTGTDGADSVSVAGTAGTASTTGLHSKVTITGAEPANDRLTVNAAGGDDVVEANGLAADAIALTENGGQGADVLVGGAGNDILNGDAGDDVLTGGPGQDQLDGGTGNNILIQ